ncbi:TIGR02679 family protein [Streptomyces sp. NBC_00893]|uniref:TIGR02679 family protein n=1 Tax=Streptomyces sp. NBC_00893 TaxID=2975862 RepID=UPI00225C1AE3|nr:TIGR02679 family protein [Streptomyces sp. NBC_00893]MCX4844598.1 TIGR02679 family protein [Streptomyces sp. NBC_00893]
MELSHGHEPEIGAVDGTRLTRLLGAPELAWLVERARRRLVAGQPLTGSVSLGDPTPAQRAAVERLLARAPGGGRTLTVRLDAVDAVLRRSGVSPNGLAAAVEALTGPVTSLAQTRQEEEDAWKRAHAPLDELVVSVPALAEWAARIRAEGLARRLGRTPDVTLGLLTGVCTALSALPAVPIVSQPAFAARVLGWAHALDDGTPLATLTLSGARALTGFHDGQGAEWRREAWAAVGLLRDELSSTVLTLNLRGTPALDRLAEDGEPCVLTLRQLTRRPPAVAAPMVRICENPTVLAAAADALGPACPPLVCLQGQPSAAALTLLRGLHDHGAALYYHGDFDWGGLRIAGILHRRVPWRPWRYTAADYRAAVLRSASPPLSPLVSTPTETPWEPALAAAVAELGVRVEEERELELLLSDLG